MYLCISSEDSQIFSVSIDNTVKVGNELVFFTCDIVCPKLSKTMHYLLRTLALISDLGYSRSVLPVYSRFQSHWNSWWHICMLIFLCYEITLHCSRLHGCAVPEDKVGCHVLLIIDSKGLKTFLKCCNKLILWYVSWWFRFIFKGLAIPDLLKW